MILFQGAVNFFSRHKMTDWLWQRVQRHTMALLEAALDYKKMYTTAVEVRNQNLFILYNQSVAITKLSPMRLLLKIIYIYYTHECKNIELPHCIAILTLWLNLESLVNLGPETETLKLFRQPRQLCEEFKLLLLIIQYFLRSYQLQRVQKNAERAWHFLIFRNKIVKRKRTIEWGGASSFHWMLF